MIKNHSIFTVKPETFYISKDTSFPLWRTEKDAIFFVVGVVQEHAQFEKGIAQVIYGENVGFLGYRYIWTGIKEYKPPPLTP